MASFLSGLTALTKAPTVQVLIERLQPGVLPLAQSKAAHALAKKAKADAASLQEIKAGGGVEALVALLNRSTSHSVQVSALEGLVALQSKAAVAPLVKLLQAQPSPFAPPHAIQKDAELKNWAANSLAYLLQVKGNYLKAAQDAGAVQAIAKMERTESVMALLHMLGPQDSNHLRKTESRNSRISHASSSAAASISDSVAELADESATAPTTNWPAELLRCFAEDEFEDTGISEEMRRSASLKTQAATARAHAQIADAMVQLQPGNRPSVQAKAAGVLAKVARQEPPQCAHIREVEAVATLEGLLRSSNDKHVRLSSLEALVALQEASAIPHLVSYMGLGTKRSMQEWAVASLQFLAQASSVRASSAVEAGALEALQALAAAKDAGQPPVPGVPQLMEVLKQKPAAPQAAQTVPLRAPSDAYSDITSPAAATPKRADPPSDDRGWTSVAL